ncbi:hypothetical protein AVEN_230627-1 [Araneus ventricosus]|uniref:Uncharacterized protein n=1 Tax=Araneus ventricosus TaxID=182803 RepID=A0A4Y2A1S2_ARAVE|nr:hypothetical protein AVEN_230627-1 [Araneus ventricosus]
MKFDILRAGGKSRSSRVRARDLQSVTYRRSYHLGTSASCRVSKTARGKWSCHLCSTTSGRVSKIARGKCSPAIRKINPDAESYTRVIPD